MDYEKLIERLKHDYHGYSTVENNPEETFHDMVECLTALSTLQAENEQLREMYQKEKAVCHAVQAELENYRKGHREEAISALSPPNEPLTIEQLREMDGEPVWVTPTGFWALVISKRGQRVQLMCSDGETVWADKEIELVGPVYRRPPEGEEDK